MELQDKIHAFIEQGKQARFTLVAWIDSPELKVYLRRAKRFINGNKEITLEIANVSVYNRGQKTFTQFLEMVERMSPWTIYVENVLEERFQLFFQKRNYQRDPMFQEDHSYFKHTNELQSQTRRSVDEQSTNHSSRI